MGYKQEQFEKIFCNLCGRDDFFVLARETKNKMPARTCLCRNCGLVYINPRMTKEAYDEYYKFFYREDRSAIKGKKEAHLADSFTGMRTFGQALARRFRNYIQPGLTMDVGSSTGGVLAGMKDIVPDIKMFGIEPSIDESKYARTHGIETHTGLFENFSDTDAEPVMQIICVQSLNHLLDPRRFFEWSFQKLTDGGHLILSVKDFRFQCRRSGRVEAGIQIDHVFMFVPETLKRFVESVGFRVIHCEADEERSLEERMRQRREGLSHHHIRLVCVKESGARSAPAIHIKNRSAYHLLRIQLWGPYLYMYYLLHYSALWGGRVVPGRKKRSFRS